MRCLLPSLFAAVAGFLLVPAAHSQAPKARAAARSKCDILCDNLMLAIQRNPGTLIMRLEDALVINERCAGEIVAAAITAVDAEPKLVDQIVKTALHVAPRRSRSIRYSVEHFTPRAPAATLAEEAPEPQPELPAGVQVGPNVEIRRAERADIAIPTALEEVRKAEPAKLSSASAPLPTPPVVEIRRAQPVDPATAAALKQAPTPKDRVSKRRRR